MPLHAEILYAANADASSVSAYRIAGNGALKPIVGSPFPSGGKWPVSIAVDILGRFLFTANMGDDTISAYRIRRNGSLTHLSNSKTGSMPESLAIDPFGRFLYTAGEYDLALLTYRIAGNGDLTNLPGSSFRAGNGFEPWNAVAADPFARFIYTSSGPENNPANATFSVYRVGTNGLTFGSSYPAGFVADSMVADFTGQFFYAAMNIVKGASHPVDGSGIAAYRITGNSTLIQVPGSPFEVGFSPDSMAICPFP
jgi:6-phosphogluconolactonase